MTNQGQDLAQWLHGGLLASVLEPGEVLGPVGRARCDGPVVRDASGTVLGLFTGMQWPGKVTESSADAFVVFTSSRVLLMPGHVARNEHGQQNTVYGLSAVRWSAMERVNVPSEALSGQKRYLNLHLRDAAAPQAFPVLKLAFWEREDGVATQRDFFDRASAVAFERVQSTHAAGVAAPPRQWDVLACAELTDRPELDAMYAARRAANDDARAATRARRYSPMNLHRAGAALALATALGAAWNAQSYWNQHVDAVEDTARVRESLRNEESPSRASAPGETEVYRLRDEARLAPLRERANTKLLSCVGLGVSVLPLLALSAWLFVRSRRLAASAEATTGGAARLTAT